MKVYDFLGFKPRRSGLEIIFSGSELIFCGLELIFCGSEVEIIRSLTYNLRS